MAGIAILSDLLRRNSGFCSSQSLHSYSARIAFSASAAASVAASKPFAYRALFGDEGPRLAYCDAAASETFSAEDYISTTGTISENILHYEPKPLMQKEYYVELKPLWYAFQWRQFAVMSLRSFLLHYLPLLEPRTNVEEDDGEDGMFPDNQESNRVDLVTPFKKSLLQIIREASIVTTRRVLERVTVLHVSKRTAWKLLKDASKSALRKAQRGIPTYVYIFRVGRTTFRTHLLVVASQWLIDVVTETCKFFLPMGSHINADTKRQPAKYLAKKVVGATIKGAGSLIFAPIGAAIFATIFRPSLGQWIGCIVGDLVGPIIVVYVLQKNNLEF